MLVTLSIQGVALIDTLDLEFDSGLSVLTGETGAGKSILLDALGLALGARGDSGLVATGRDQAAVTAGFSLPERHPALAIAAEADLTGEEGELVLRRTVSADGRSRAFVNDQPVSVGLLRRIGAALVEVVGQHDQRGLLDMSGHRLWLDRAGGLQAQTDAVRGAWERWRAAEEERAAMVEAAERAARDEDYLRHVLDELDTLAPEDGEETRLAERRATLMSRERLSEALTTADAAVAGGSDVSAGINAALRALERQADKAAGVFDAAIAALERAAVELDEARNEIARAADRLELDGHDLPAVEDRLFALREAARKHRVGPDELPALRTRLAAQLETLDAGSRRLAELEAAVSAARSDYETQAHTLSAARTEAAAKLDAAIAGELPPLRLDKARFRAVVEPLPDEDWGPSGMDRIGFEVSTNPGAPFGPIGRIASGGELSRFMLALRLALSGEGGTTLVFDEVDAGIGGATAAAVGERLARVARSTQVLVVTHSPQVAARGARHLRIAKGEADRARVVTTATALDRQERREEIARMLSGERITEEARAAADSLLRAAG